MKTIAWIALMIFLCAPAWADESMVRVIRAIDGDTLEVSLSGEMMKVRLNGIDAPETGQAFGMDARAALQSLCAGTLARLVKSGTDKYGRALGDLYCGGVWANERMVQTGAAWMYRKYSSDPQLDAAEALAKRNGAGLWAQSGPMAPWEWRHAKKGEGEGSGGVTDVAGRRRAEAVAGVAERNRPVVAAQDDSFPTSFARSSGAESTTSQSVRDCHIGPRGGRYTITSSGRKDYNGCR